MEIYRITFQLILNDAIREREKIEKHVWGYKQDSSYLASIRELLDKSDSEDTIILKDDNV